MDRKAVSDHYKGHEIDFNTAVDRMEIMQDGADPKVELTDDDTEVTLGPKTPENPNDPYCTC
jgi:hypothetical protein